MAERGVEIDHATLNLSKVTLPFLQLVAKLPATSGAHHEYRPSQTSLRNARGARP